jgi:NAD+ synthase
VYKLAAVLGVPADVRARRPTTDTYSLPQSQDEFYFSLPYEQMDLALWAKNNGVPAAEAAAALDLTPAQMERVYRDIDQKRRTTRPLHLNAILLEPVPEVKT